MEVVSNGSLYLFVDSLLFDSFIKFLVCSELIGANNTTHCLWVAFSFTSVFDYCCNV